MDFNLEIINQSELTFIVIYVIIANHFNSNVARSTSPALIAYTLILIYASFLAYTI